MNPQNQSARLGKFNSGARAVAGAAALALGIVLALAWTAANPSAPARTGPASGFSRPGGFTDHRLGHLWRPPVTGSVLVEKNGAPTGRTAAFFGGGKKPDPARPGVGGWFFIVDAVGGDSLAVFELPDKDQVANFDPLIYHRGENTNEVPGSAVIYDSDRDGMIDRAYIGDHQGRVWKITLADPDPGHWERCLFYDLTDSDGDAGPDSEEWRRPIWYAPALVRGPEDSLIVYFISGHADLGEDTGKQARPNHVFAVRDPDDPGSDRCSYGVLMQVLADRTETAWPLELRPGEKPVSELYVWDGRLVFASYQVGPNLERLRNLDYLTGKETAD